MFGALSHPAMTSTDLTSSHAKVIVILLRELLTAELVHLSHLSCKSLTRLKAFRVQDHLQGRGCLKVKDIVELLGLSDKTC